MAKEWIKFMEDALGNQALLDDFETEFNKLYDAQGNQIDPAADRKLSAWFDQKDYTISPGQCKKLSGPVNQARGKVMPQY